MMQTEFLIIGQGISGTFLSWELQRAGRSFLVIDNGNGSSSSRTAAGIINPVTGRRIVKTWMIDELMPFAVSQYQSFGSALGITAISPKNIVDFFPSPQTLLSFRERIAGDGTYLRLPDAVDLYSDRFNYDFGFGEIAPCYAVDIRELLATWRERLDHQQQLMAEEFKVDELVTAPRIRYRDISAEKIIFCDGIRSSENIYFKNLPFAFNKGEALIIEAELPEDRIFKKSMNLVPLGGHLFWAGSSYQWNFEDHGPSEPFRDSTLRQLRAWLKVPFKLIDHLAAVRPATIERRPFVGVHPHHPNVAILNGMGTKGCSLAPYFAAQLANLLVNDVPVMAEAGVNRFSRVLK